MEKNTERIYHKDKMHNQPLTVLKKVYAALKERGYNPEGQLVGYLISGDPAYITSHKEARNNICLVERETLLDEIVTFYLSELEGD